jgi:hypothetical protein
MLGMQTKKATPKTALAAESPTAGTWIDQEVAGCTFGDVRWPAGSTSCWE